MTHIPFWQTHRRNLRVRKAFGLPTDRTMEMEMQIGMSVKGDVRFMLMRSRDSTIVTQFILDRTTSVINGVQQTSFHKKRKRT